MRMIEIILPNAENIAPWAGNRGQQGHIRQRQNFCRGGQVAANQGGDPGLCDRIGCDIQTCHRVFCFRHNADMTRTLPFKYC